MFRLAILVRYDDKRAYHPFSQATSSFIRFTAVLFDFAKQYHCVELKRSLQVLLLSLRPA